MAKNDNKGDISRGNLQRYDIFYSDTRYDPSQSDPFAFPDHIDSVREGLLEMENVIADCWRRHLRHEAEWYAKWYAEQYGKQYAELDMGPTWSSMPPSSAFVREEQHLVDRRKHSTEWIVADKSLERCLKIAKRARELLKFPEAEWNFFWRRHVFRLFSEEACRQPSFNPALDEWSLYGEVTWTGFHDWVESRAQEGAIDRTMPKPDLTYAFPVRPSQSKNLKGFARDEHLQTFSLEVLGKLVAKDISCAPTTAIQQWVKAPDKSEMSDTDRSCFPWAVVEMKRHATRDEASIERCYCQAANGAAAALDMHAQLFRKSDLELLSRQPPIITFTCVGPIVKVWLTYQDESRLFQKPKKWMICIWTTSVQLTWGVASLRAILMNMHTWASRLLKPKIQGCVYRVSASLRSMGQESSSASSLPTCSPTIHTSEDPANESQLHSNVPNPYLSLSQTPQRRQSSDPEHRQGQTPTKQASRELQSPFDSTQPEVRGFLGQSFCARDWASQSFHFSPTSDAPSSGHLDSPPEDSTSQRASNLLPEPPTNTPDVRPEHTPVAMRPVLGPRTTQTRCRVVDQSTSQAVAASPSKSTLAPIERIQDALSIQNEHKESDFSDQISDITSSKVDNSFVNGVAEGVNGIVATSVNDSSHAQTSTSVATSSTARVQGLLGLTTSGVLVRPNPGICAPTIAGTGVQHPLFPASVIASYSTNLTPDPEVSKTDSNANGTNTESDLPQFSEPADSIPLARLDLSDMSAEIRDIEDSIYSRPHLESGAPCEAVATGHHHESECEPSRGLDTPQRHGTRTGQVTDDSDDDGATPRPSANRDHSRSSFFDVFNTSGPPKAREQVMRMFGHNSLFDQLGAQDKTSNKTSSVNYHGASECHGSGSGTDRLERPESFLGVMRADEAITRYDIPQSSQTSVQSVGTSSSSTNLEDLRSLMSSKIASDTSDNGSDADYSPDSEDLSGDGDSEYSDHPTDSGSNSEREHDAEEEDIRSWSGESTDSYKPYGYH